MGEERPATSSLKKREEEKESGAEKRTKPRGKGREKKFLNIQKIRVGGKRFIWNWGEGEKGL